jgi:hypothetical protein
MMPESMAWPGIALLGVWHGVNPGMGWLFAVALGLQCKERRAVWRAFPPLALGHAVAVAGALLLAVSLEVVVPVSVLRWVVGVTLVGFGISKLVSSRHPRYGGMLVNARQLTVWSALMAAAHGAGLMVVPFVLDGTPRGAAEGPHAGHLAAMTSGPGAEAAVMATVVHTIGYLTAACLLAFLVYEYLGVSVIKRWWVNLDRIWAATLIVTGVLTPLW